MSEGDVENEESVVESSFNNFEKPDEESAVKSSRQSTDQSEIMTEIRSEYENDEIVQRIILAERNENRKRLSI